MAIDCNHKFFLKFYHQSDKQNIFGQNKEEKLGKGKTFEKVPFHRLMGFVAIYWESFPELGVSAGFLSRKEEQICFCRTVEYIRAFFKPFFVHEKCVK